MEEICDFITGQSFTDTDDERIRQKIERLLVEEKGYSKEDIEIDREFEIVIDGEINRSRAALVLNIEEKRFMVIKCARGSLVSREREVLSCARILDVYQIPFAVVTNGKDAEVLDTLSGEVIGYGLEAIPSRSQALEALRGTEFKRLPEKRIEKEKRGIREIAFLMEIHNWIFPYRIASKIFLPLNSIIHPKLLLLPLKSSQ